MALIYAPDLVLNVANHSPNASAHGMDEGCTEVCRFDGITTSRGPTRAAEVRQRLAALVVCVPVVSVGAGWQASMVGVLEAGACSEGMSA